MKTIVTHTLFGLACIIATAWLLANTWPTEPCAKVTAIVDQRVESLRAFEAKTIEEQDRYIASLKEIVMMLQASNNELATTRDAAVRKVKELEVKQPVAPIKVSTFDDVMSIKALAQEATKAEKEIRAQVQPEGWVPGVVRSQWGQFLAGLAGRR